MNKKVGLKKLCCLGLFVLAPLFASVMTASGEMEENADFIQSFDETMDDSTKIIESQRFNLIDTEHLTTKLLVQTANEFEALLLDDQSQGSLGHLYWNQDDAEGKIVFNYGGIEEDIAVQISNLEEMEPSDRCDLLLRGLHEAGIAWISQYKAPSMAASEDPQQESDIVEQDSGDVMPDSDDPMQDSDDTVQDPDDTEQESTILQQESGSISLQASNRLVRGWIDKVTPKWVTETGRWPRRINRYLVGWAFDPDHPAKNVSVHIYGRRVMHDRGYPRFVGLTLANLNSPDVNRRFHIQGKHRWRFQIPEGWDADGFRDIGGICHVTRKQRSTEVFCWSAFIGYGIDINGSRPGHPQPVRLNGAVGAVYERTY